MTHEHDKREREISAEDCALLEDLRERLAVRRCHDSGERKLDEIQHALHRLGAALMSKISEFAQAQNAFNDRLDTAIQGLTGDLAELSRQIAVLQESQGQITPEDQATLDALQARAAAMTAKLEALDALTPPVPPTA